METKEHIRKQMLKERNDLTYEQWQEKSMKIQQRILSWKHYEKAESLFLYKGLGKEVSTDFILTKALKDGKKVFFPKVHGKELIFYEIRTIEEFLPGTYGILEPTTKKIAKKMPDLVIMPCLAVDKERNRIGYGKGYYDRYLEKQKDLLTVALAFSFQMRDKVPVEEKDVALQFVVTEKCIIGERI